RRHTRCYRDWSSDVCSSDLDEQNLRQIVQRIVCSRVGQVSKALCKSFHRRLLPNQKPPSESTSPSLAMTYKNPHAIPLPARGERSEERRVGKGSGAERVTEP